MGEAEEKREVRPGAKKRPVVGVMTGSFSSDYPRSLVKALRKQMKGMDMDIRLYSSIESNLFFGNYSSFDEGFDRHGLSVFDYSSFDAPDLLIVAYGNIMSSHPNDDAKDFLSRLPDVPVIMLGNDSVMVGGYYAVIDNYSGMKQNIDHLIEYHKCRNIAMVSGFWDSESAKIRLAAYRDSLREHGLPVRDSMIVYGDYSNNVDDVVETLFVSGNEIDAIVVANDEMCNAVYRVAKFHGREIGEDLAVVGFDDADFAEYMKPPLTTVRQDINQLVQGLVEMIRSYFEMGQMESKRLPARCVRRRSCGCKNEISEMLMSIRTRNPIHKYVTHDEMHDMQQRYMISALVLRNLLLDSTSYRAFFRKLGQEMYGVGTKSSYLCMLERPLWVAENERPILPETLRLVMWQQGGRGEWHDLSDAPVVKRGDLAAGLSFVRDRNDAPLAVKDDGAKWIAVYLLFYGNYQYGTLSVEVEPEDVFFYYSLSIQISSGLRYLSLALQQAEMNRLLQGQNHVLDYEARHDKLTGLYNRMGIMESMAEFVGDGDGREYVAVMADLDHLKQINDTFGHVAGDEAICSVADILARVLPKGSPVGRSGGDEFMAAFVVEDGQSPEEVTGRIKAACERYNDKEKVPYYLGISVGCAAFAGDGEADLEAVFRLADEALYEDKKLRRENVVRGD